MLLYTISELVIEVMFIALRTISTAANSHYVMFGNTNVIPLRDFTGRIYIALCVIGFGMTMQLYTLALQGYNYYIFDRT